MLKKSKTIKDYLEQGTLRKIPEGYSLSLKKCTSEDYVNISQLLFQGHSVKPAFKCPKDTVIWVREDG